MSKPRSSAEVKEYRRYFGKALHKLVKPKPRATVSKRDREKNGLCLTCGEPVCILSDGRGGPKGAKSKLCQKHKDEKAAYARNRAKLMAQGRWKTR